MKLQRTRKTVLFFSFMLFPFTFMYLSPYLAVMGTVYGVASSGLLFWGAFMLTSLILGRSACGWICPLGGLQMCMRSAYDGPARSVRYLKVIKYLIWAPWVGSILIIAFMRGGYERVDLLFHVGDGLPPYPREAYIIMLGFMLLATIPALALGRRGFCHYLCFFAPLNVIGSRVGRVLRLPVLRVRVVEQDACKTCGLCSRECPMSLKVQDMVQTGAINHLECIDCGNCSAVCKFGALKYGFTGNAGRAEFQGRGVPKQQN